MGVPTEAKRRGGAGGDAREEVYPFADGRVLSAARKLGLGGDPRTLGRLVERGEFARLTSALIRVDLAHAYEQVRDAAIGAPRSAL
jgi:hypothetical protein